jgi:hypothetical protein
LIETPSQKTLFEPIKEEKPRQLTKTTKTPRMKNKKVSEVIKEQDPVTTAELTQKQEPVITQFNTTLPLTDLEKPVIEKSVINESLKIQPTREETEPKSVVPLEESQLPIEQKGKPQSDYQCGHYFGFLRERANGAEIPRDCFECPQSIECMLFNSNLSSERFQEIKKWYPVIEKELAKSAT